MPSLRQYNIFISHAWSYHDEYDRLEQMLINAKYFNIVNYSAPREKPLAPPDEPVSKAQLKRAITEKIRHAQVVIVIAGMWANHRDWVQYEVDEAQRMGKPILCVLPRGQERSPVDLRNLADKVVKWSVDSIVGAIREIAQ